VVGVRQFKTIVQQEVAYQKHAGSIVNESLEVFFVKSVEQKTCLLGPVIKCIVMVELNLVLVAFALQLLLTLLHFLKTSFANHTGCTKESSESESDLIKGRVSVFGLTAEQHIFYKDFSVNFAALTCFENFSFGQVKVRKKLDTVEIDDRAENGLKSNITMI